MSLNFDITQEHIQKVKDLRKMLGLSNNKRLTYEQLITA